jgi:hypothetical protein
MGCECDLLVETDLEEWLARCSEWPKRFAPEEWELYRSVIAEAGKRHIPFAIGGALAALTYAGGWRNTKDLDIYIVKADCPRFQQILLARGFEDYYDVLAYDRRWIYRAHRDDIIVDIIWAMANQRAQVDESWLNGPEVHVAGETFRLLAPEDSLWSKLYIIQKDRCDWTDCLNILYGVGPHMNWHKLIANAGRDVPLLAGLLSVFTWLAPDRARALPSFIWRELRLSAPDEHMDEAGIRQRVDFIDTRPWFYPLQSNRDREASTPC